MEWSCYIRQLMMILASDNQPKHDDGVVQWSCYIRQLRMIFASDRYWAFGNWDGPARVGWSGESQKFP